MNEDRGALTKSLAEEPAVVGSAIRSLVRLMRALLDHAPWDAVLVVAVTFALVLTSGVSLLMLVPLLGVAGLDVGGGSIGRLAQIAEEALSAVGLSVSVPVVVGAYLALVLGSASLGHLHAMRSALLYQGFVMALRLRMYEAITGSRWSSYTLRSGSSFIHALTHETERVGGALSGLLDLVVKLVMTVLYLALALYLSLITTLLVAACGGLLTWLLAQKTRLGRAKGDAVSRAYEALYGAITEHLAGLRIIKSHGIEPYHLERFRQRAQRTASAQADVARNRAGLGFWQQVGSATIMAGVFVVALMAFELELASILLLLYVFARLVPNLTGLQRQVQQVLVLLPAVERIDATLAWLSEHAESTGAVADAPELTRTLRFDQVSFGYRGPDGEVVLHDVDLEVRAGRTTAIVGPSGGGKSTVADLVVGLLTPDRGRVLVDDVPLEGGRIAGWRRRLGYVNQDTFLFNDSIHANLLLVRPEASEAELVEALRAASADFVMALSDGLDTVVGDRGVRLSGGERQRIALARAILRKPALLVLDEATSALDPENERVIQEAIAGMAGRQTILLIAHRLASVRGADVIYVMEHGRVVESGGWDELIRRPQGRFRELCRAQGLVDGSQAAIATD